MLKVNRTVSLMSHYFEGEKFTYFPVILSVILCSEQFQLEGYILVISAA